MIRIGKYNEMRIARFVEFGAYLVDADDPSGKEILMPGKYLDDRMVVGDQVKVFVYPDSEDRLVATTEVPFAQVGEFAFLQVVQVNRIGAFLDWGLAKNLLCPFSEQKVKMHEGGIYLVYVFLDDASGRVVASARINKFLGNVPAEYRRGQKVSALVYGRNEIGFKAIVDNLHKGLIYDNELFRPVEIEEVLTTYVKGVRPDGKIDLTLTMPGTANRVERVAESIMSRIEAGGFSLTDNSTPEEIKDVMHCSKKDFKKAVGMLYKAKRITVTPEGKLLKA